MSCSARAAPPVPWNCFTPAIVPGPGAEKTFASGGTYGTGAVAPPAPCARLTEVTEPSTDCAAVAVRPALVRPLTKRRREIECDRYLATSSRIVALQIGDQCGVAAGLA